jgi:oxygen-independent coproporphyrinogen III oxidase
MVGAWSWFSEVNYYSVKGCAIQMPFHLYFHLPYCQRKCPYCDFYKIVPRTGDRERFVSALMREIPVAKMNHSWASGPVQTVYFGGGTPSLHPPHEIRGLLTEVHRVWGIASGAEITLEANPGGLSPEFLGGWLEAGVNRLSLGAQSFSPRKLAQLFCDHRPEDIVRSVENAHAARFSNISLDLIFGLPEETLEEWTADLNAAYSLNAEHISLYNLEFHEGTPFHRWREAGRLKPLPEDFEADLYLTAHEFFVSRGFEHYEISNFARPGFRSRHNLAYWKSKPYLGLGPSAHSFDGQALRFQNVADMSAYLSALDSGRLPIEKELHLSENERAEEWIWLSLRRSEGIYFDAACAHLGEPSARALWQRALELPSVLREITPRMFRLTPEGWFREDSVLLWLFCTN